MGAIPEAVLPIERFTSAGARQRSAQVFSLSFVLRAMSVAERAAPHNSR